MAKSAPRPKDGSNKSNMQNSKGGTPVGKTQMPAGRRMLGHGKPMKHPVKTPMTSGKY